MTKYYIARKGSARYTYTVEAPAGQFSRAIVVAERFLLSLGETEDGRWEVHGLGESWPLSPRSRAEVDAYNEAMK